MKGIRPAHAAARWSASRRPPPAAEPPCPASGTSPAWAMAGGWGHPCKVKVRCKAARPGQQSYSSAMVDHMSATQSAVHDTVKTGGSVMGNAIQLRHIRPIRPDVLTALADSPASTACPLAAHPRRPWGPGSRRLRRRRPQRDTGHCWRTALVCSGKAVHPEPLQPSSMWQQTALGGGKRLSVRWMSGR